MKIIGMRTRLDYARIYYRMSTYLQVLTCIVSQINWLSLHNEVYVMMKNNTNVVALCEIL